MSDETDLIKLYSGRILALAADIPHHKRLEAPMATVKKRSPLCGSTVIVDLIMEDGHVTAFGQDVKACALGQAAAAVTGGSILGRSAEELCTARDQLRAMLKEGGDPLLTWSFVGAYPVKWSVSDFNSMENKISIESLEFAYQYYTLIQN